MKTITPFELQTLIDKRYVEVIDVRAREDFKKAHVLVARSIPPRTFEPHSVLAHRRSDKHAPLYIIGERKAIASLVAGELAAAGLAEPVVVEGGSEAWEEQGLPVVRERSWRNLGSAVANTLSAWHRRLRSFLRSYAIELEPPTVRHRRARL
jgi:rhodanese-related sulfurtransferase